MKNFRLSVYDIVILIIFFSSITLDVFWNFLISIFDIILFSNHFANPYNFAKFLTSNTMTICDIVWLNKILFLIAGIVPSLILYIVLKNTDVPNWLNIILNIVLYYGVLQLFSAVWFWILLFIVLLMYIIYRLIIYFKNKKAKHETKIQ
jgi:hypothetical protein